MSYAELEKAMSNKTSNYQKYLKIRKKNLHKWNQFQFVNLMTHNLKLTNSSRKRIV